MRTPRTLVTLGLSFAALAFSPACAAEPQQAETVDITVDLDAPAEEIYQSIRNQAWTACKGDLGSHHIAARMNARRSCQQAMIADVVEALEAPEVTRLAANNQVCIKS